MEVQNKQNNMKRKKYNIENRYWLIFSHEKRDFLFLLLKAHEMSMSAWLNEMDVYIQHIWRQEYFKCFNISRGTKSN
jgi:hypothetical protein